MTDKQEAIEAIMALVNNHGNIMALSVRDGYVCAIDSNCVPSGQCSECTTEAIIKLSMIAVLAKDQVYQSAGIFHTQELAESRGAQKLINAGWRKVIDGR